MDRLTTKVEIPQGVTISEEHGWICIRTDTGWLMWSAKISKMPAKGLFLASVLTEALSESLPPNPRPEPAPHQVGTVSV